jgi:hypothetical protein
LGTAKRGLGGGLQGWWDDSTSEALLALIDPKRCKNELAEGRGTGSVGCGRESRRKERRSGVGIRSRGGKKKGKPTARG